MTDNSSPRMGQPGADERAGPWRLVQSCPPLTSGGNLRKKLSLSEPQFPNW